MVALSLNRHYTHFHLIAIFMWLAKNQIKWTEFFLFQCVQTKILNAEIDKVNWSRGSCHTFSIFCSIAKAAQHANIQNKIITQPVHRSSNWCFTFLRPDISAIIFFFFSSASLRARFFQSHAKWSWSWQRLNVGLINFNSRKWNSPIEKKILRNRTKKK